MKIKKKFIYEGIELRIIEKEEPYLNSGRTVTVKRVIAPNGGIIPVNIYRKQTLKDIVTQTIITLDNFKSLGANVKQELLRNIN